MLLRGAYGLSLRSLIGRHLLQLTASPWTTEASTRERWQFGALTNGKATSSNRDPSLISHWYYQVALSLYRDKWTTIIRLWWLSQWLVTHGHHLAVTICLHVAPSTGRHTRVYVPFAPLWRGRQNCLAKIKIFLQFPELLFCTPYIYKLHSYISTAPLPSALSGAAVVLRPHQQALWQTCSIVT